MLGNAHRAYSKVKLKVCDLFNITRSLDCKLSGSKSSIVLQTGCVNYLLKLIAK